jgi:hypothetical protein
MELMVYRRDAKDFIFASPCKEHTKLMQKEKESPCIEHLI